MIKIINKLLIILMSIKFKIMNNRLIKLLKKIMIIGMMMMIQIKALKIILIILIKMINKISIRNKTYYRTTNKKNINNNPSRVLTFKINNKTLKLYAIIMMIGMMNEFKFFQ